MKIILANKIELEPIMVTGAKRNVQGSLRDTLSFVFPADAGMEALDNAFTTEACESITVINDEGEYIHKGYTIRVDLNKQSVEVTPATADAAAVYEDRITVSMSQRTYMEAKMFEMEKKLVALTGEN